MRRNIPEIPVRRLEKIINDARHYLRGMELIAGEKGTFYKVGGWSDYDGYPFVDVLCLRCFPKGADSEKFGSRTWELRIGYSDTGEGIYDYVRDIPRASHKAKHPGLGGKTRFKLDDDFVLEGSHGLSEANERCVLADLLALELILARLNRLTKDIFSWSDAGFDMVVICSNDLCFRRAVVSNGVILAYAKDGLSLEDFVERFSCEECGEKSAKLYPCFS